MRRTGSIMYISLSCDLKGASCMAKRSDSTDFVAKKKTGPNRGFLDSSITNALRLVSGFCCWDGTAKY